MLSLLLSLSLCAFAQDAAPAPEAAAEAAPAEEAAPPVARNVDLQVSLTSADKKTKSGHVIRIERSEDIAGDKGWLDDDKSLKFYVESGKEYKKITWAEVKKISIKVVDAKDISCLYSSDTNPWTYECGVKLSTQLTTKDGKRYTADSGHKWRFFFEDGTEAELWLKRHYARQMDDREVQLGDNDENVALYRTLQAQLKAELSSTLVKTITVK
jgi:hypothetical protein